MTTQIILPNSAFLGNFEKFLTLNTFPLDNTKVNLTSPYKWVSLHPLVSAMLAPISHKSPFLSSVITIHNSLNLEDFFSKTLPSYQLNSQDLLLTKYILSELTRNTLEHASTPDGVTLALTHSVKTDTLRLGVSDRGVGIGTTIRRLYPDQTDYETIITALTPGVTGSTNFSGGNTQNAGAGLFFVKSLTHQLGSHFLLYSGTGLFKLLKRKTIRSILKPDSLKDHASGSNDFPFWHGTAVGVDIPLNKSTDFNTALTQIRAKFMSSTEPKVQFL